MSILIVPGAVGNTNPARTIFDNPFLYGCSADVQSCVPTGALNAQAQSAASPAVTPTQVQPAVPQRELSGASWVAQFPTGTSTSDLTPAFRDAVDAFIQAIRSAGGAVSIAATYRPPERAYLMHYAWKIANGTIQSDRVPAMVGMNIEWDHGNKQSSVNAAKAMKTGYGMKHIAALGTNHTSRIAIDMNVSGMIGKSILNKEGTNVKITAVSDLYLVGATYGVHKLESDPPHWSADGH